jgi:hypothetical protein
MLCSLSLPKLAVLTADASAFRQGHVLCLNSCAFAFVTMHHAARYRQMISVSVLDDDCDDNIMLPNTPMTLLFPAA